ncbi:fimbria/pilus outer membrane usher protein [Rosenbergiella australiborealis]|uniref:fimbria/pilus outer membrane usher protein n=1 Tax=Rosenbergiella australiborealis TaxID=1544696 RepID=UPI001F4D523E|nr:fimbria/pilus outer membrane usher protein [Rosenbergiella australiborealis]
MKQDRHQHPSFRITRLVVCLSLSSLSHSVFADTYFNPRFLSDDPSAVASLSNFEKGIEAPPGTYRVNIYVNGSYTTNKEVNFIINKNKNRLEPCLSFEQLQQLGLNGGSINDVSKDNVAEQCFPFTDKIKDATSTFDVGTQKLSLNIPQAYMQSHGQDYISPELWSEGIPAAMVNYNFTANRSSTQSVGTSDLAYLNLQSGINLGAWRLRDNTAWNYSNSNSSHDSNWQHINTYLERDIIPLRSRLTLGDSYTDSDIFDSVNFRGIKLAKTDSMLPDSERGYAPVIHGIAHTTAVVTVRQNGYDVYQSTVPAGPFVIKDIYSASNSGDLQVTVKEADGSVQNFTIPYSSVPLLQREGYLKYNLSAGEFRSGNNQQSQPDFVQASFLKGLSSGWTIYSGTQLSDHYKSFNTGVGKNLGQFGALSTDLTYAKTQLYDNTDHTGHSLRILYSKALSRFGTNIQVVGYRYSTKGYYSLSDSTWKAMNGYSVDTNTTTGENTIVDAYNLNYSKKGRFQVSLTQQAGALGTIFATGSEQTYWGTDSKDQQWQLGYSGNITDISYSLTYALTKTAWVSDTDKSIAFSISIPFSHFMQSNTQSIFRNASASYNMTNDLKGNSIYQTGVYGTLLAEQNLSYNIQKGYNQSSSGSSGSTSAALYYRGGYGNTNINYSDNSGSRQVYFGQSGGILFHSQGVTFSQPLNDTMILVRAPGAKNVSILNQTGVKTDWRGYAVLPYATDYRNNRVALDTHSLANNVDIENTVDTVVPTHGAVVAVDFNTHIGIKLLLTLTHKGKPLPFGSNVSATDSANNSIVGDNGQVYLAGMPLHGIVKANWGDQPDQQCTASYQLEKVDTRNTLSYATAECQ